MKWVLLGVGAYVAAALVSQKAYNTAAASCSATAGVPTVSLTGGSSPLTNCPAMAAWQAKWGWLPVSWLNKVMPI